MVETRINQHDKRGHIVLSPNLSVRWRTNVIFLYIVCSFALIIGVSFAMIGMWMILPFTGLEVLALVTVVYYVAHKCHRIEVIHVSDEEVLVERGYRRPQSNWSSETFWTRMIVSRQERPWHPLRVFLRGRDGQIEIGAFLNDDDKRILIKQLRQFVAVV